MRCTNSENAVIERTESPSCKMDNKKPFDLLKLPRELRDKIYHDALVFEGQIILQKRRIRLETAHHDFTAAENTDYAHCPYWTPGNGASMDNQLYKHSKKDLPSVSLFRTCRQVFEESLPVLYGRNKFTVFSWRPGANGLSEHYGVIESIEREALPLISRHFDRKYFDYLKHLTIHVHAWPFGVILLPWLSDVILHSQLMTHDRPYLKQLRIIIRVGTLQAPGHGRWLYLKTDNAPEGDQRTFDIIRDGNQSCDDKEEETAAWMAERMDPLALGVLETGVQLRLMHEEIKDERDATLLSDALQRARMMVHGF